LWVDNLGQKYVSRKGRTSIRLGIDFFAAVFQSVLVRDWCLGCQGEKRAIVILCGELLRRRIVASVGERYASGVSRLGGERRA
jgi:hypothetical protein